MIKILTIVGARPQFVKAATLSREIIKRNDIEEIIVHTGQHFDANMSDVFFEEMSIPKPKYNLEVHSLGHGAMTGRMLEGIEKILLDEKPSLVLVYGDTNSTLAGALAAKKLHIKVAHVEAGLRSFNMQMPEEVNRILTDRISDYLFCPTDTAIENLKNEGYSHFSNEILRTGDVMQDAALFYAEISKEKSHIANKIELDNFVLCTLHRAENTDSPARLKAIIEGLNCVNQVTPVLMPIHPRTQKIVEAQNIKPEFEMIDPVGYFDMIELLKKCELVMTDSGGLQKEAFFFKKPCVTIRDQTEWVELIEKGFNILADAKAIDIFEKYSEMRNRVIDFDNDLYGNGTAASTIINYLVNKLN